KKAGISTKHSITSYKTQTLISNWGRLTRTPANRVSSSVLPKQGTGTALPSASVAEGLDQFSLVLQPGRGKANSVSPILTAFHGILTAFHGSVWAEHIGKGIQQWAHAVLNPTVGLSAFTSYSLNLCDLVEKR
ncbi:hypothetical protein STEG23_036369, partial [Scotinomys teguina]